MATLLLKWKNHLKANRPDSQICKYLGHGDDSRLQTYIEKTCSNNIKLETDSLSSKWHKPQYLIVYE